VLGHCGRYFRENRQNYCEVRNVDDDDDDNNDNNNLIYLQLQGFENFLTRLGFDCMPTTSTVTLLCII
jgi:hypothetical protein